MTKPFSIRFEEDLQKKLEAEAERTKKSVGQLVNEAVDHFFKCDKAEGIEQLHMIVLKYPTTCKGKCKKELKAGDWAYYARGFGAICLDCFIERLGDKAIVKKFMKIKELKWTQKALETQLDEKADQLRQFNFYDIINKMHDGYSEIYKLMMEYLKQGFDKPEAEKKALDDLERLIQKQWAIIEEAQLFIKGPPLKKKKKTSKQDYAT